MSSQAGSKWYPLPFLPQSDPDKSLSFFFKFNRDSDSKGFQLLVTDLSTAWREKRSRREVFGQALTSETCSIDPSEDPSQYETLLEKLSLSLSGQEESTNKIRFAANDSLQIDTSIPLPTPLKPLEWRFQLSCMNVPGETGIQQEILVPALEAAARRDEQILSLKQHLRNKDHVISRLLDKIGSSGIDLSMVFPGLTSAKSGKKKVDADQANRSVAGLAAFDETEWEVTQNQTNSSDTSTTDGLLEAIRGAGNATSISQDVDDASAPENQTAQVKPRKSSDASTATGTGSEAEDEKLDEQTDKPSKSQEHNDAATSRKIKTKTMGSTKSSTSSSDGEPTSSKHEKQKPTSIHGSSSTASDSDFATLTKQPTSKPPPRRLGGIGAHNPPPPSTTRSKSPDVPPASTPPTHPTTPSRKLGAIGSRKLPLRSSASPSSPAAPSSATKRSRSAHSPSPSPERKSKAKGKGKSQPSKAETDKEKETTDEKIERKRTEIKKIEEGPVKKKGRKF